MITYVVGGLFQSPARVLVNTANTVGVMGKGIALEFKRIYPEMFAEYQVLCEKKQLNIGQLWLYKTPHKWILNFPTKKHWRLPSRPEYIEAGLKKFVEIYAEQGITSISFPLLGCGNGELDWESVVKPLMERYLKKLPIETFIHLDRSNPFFVPEARDSEAIKFWLRSEPESLAFTEVWDDLRSVLQSQTVFQTLANQTTFRATVKTQPSGIAIETEKDRFFIDSEALLDLWQQIRGLGFCMAQNMPSGLDSLAEYVVALMAKLTYLKPVLLSRDYTAINRDKKHAIGLQLIPRTSMQNGPLFSNVQTLQRV